MCAAGRSFFSRDRFHQEHFQLSTIAVYRLPCCNPVGCQRAATRSGQPRVFRGRRDSHLFIALACRRSHGLLIGGTDRLPLSFTKDRDATQWYVVDRMKDETAPAATRRSLYKPPSPIISSDYGESLICVYVCKRSLYLIHYCHREHHGLHAMLEW